MQRIGRVCGSTERSHKASRSGGATSVPIRYTAMLSDQYGRISEGDGALRFVGVYSGRFHTNDASDAQLGRVWPARLVMEIIDHMATAAPQRR